MNSADVPDVLRLMAHDVRWALLAELVRSDRRVAELVALTGRPQNLVSYHLGRLRAGGVVVERRSSADARDVYYHLDLGQLEALYSRSGRALHPALACGKSSWAVMPAGHLPRVLFLCTHNSARSQMAEALWRRTAGPDTQTASAGSEPSAVHPLAIRVMAERGIDIGRRRAKDTGEVAAQPWDVVVTVCDRMREVCPAFPAGTRAIHWSIADPAAVAGPEGEQLAAFRAAADEIAARITSLAYESQATPSEERHDQ